MPEQRARFARMAARGSLVAGALLLGACTAAPLQPFAVEVPAGVTDGRGRFAEILCAVLESHGGSAPDNRACDAALSHVVSPAAGNGAPVDLGRSQRSLLARLVPGIGYACIAPWLQAPTTLHDRLAGFGYDLQLVDVDALSGTVANAARIRDAILALPPPAGPPNVVLMGYSKGAPDVLEAVVRFPELQQRVAAVVGIAGAVGGSPLADDAQQSQVDGLRHWPGARCDAGDGGAIEALRPGVRKAWLAANPLPPRIRYYSVVTLPERGRVSNALAPAHRKLARIDPRNDGQVIYSDQFIPGSTLLGFVNADHWAVALPIDRVHAVVGSTLANHNDFPREALYEAILRYVEEDLAQPERVDAPPSAE